MNDFSSPTVEQAIKALQTGDKKSATRILHQILKEDITNQSAWKLLHKSLAPQVNFNEFQSAFAQKYFADQAFLLTFSKPEEQKPAFTDVPSNQNPFLQDSNPFTSSEVIPPPFGGDAPSFSNSPFYSEQPQQQNDTFYTGPLEPPPAVNEISKEEWAIDPKESMPAATFSPRIPKHERKRGGCLAVYLILSIISGVIGILATIFVLAMLPWFKEQILVAARETPQLLVFNQLSSAVFIGILVYAVLQLVVFIGIWKWKSWALYGFVGLSILGFFFQVLYSDLTSAFCGLTSPVLLFILAFRQWDDFD